MIRERILEAAFFEFSEKGFYDTNIDGITRRVNISRVIFYSYFKNKKDVLICLLEGLRYELSAFLLDRRCQKLWLNTDDINEFQQPVIYLSEILADSSGLVRALVQGVLMEEEIFLLFSNFLGDFASIFQSKIRSIQNNGRFQGCSPVMLSQIMSITLIMSIFSLTIGAFHCRAETLAKQLSIFFFSFLNMDEKAARASDSCEPKSEKTRKTRRAILDAVKHEFSEEQKKPVTIASIAKRAGINRSTVYLHFKKKEEILKALSEDPNRTTYSFSPLIPLSRSDESCFMRKESGDDEKEKSLTRVEKNLQKKDKLRKKIIESAKGVFSDKGYFGTTIEMIANASSYSRNTIYKYFIGKDDILGAIFDEMFILFHPAIKESDSIIHKVDTTRIDSLLEINSLIINLFEKYSKVYRALLQGSLQSEELRKKFIEIYGRIDKPLRKKIRELQAGGKCKAVSPAIASRIIQTYQAHTIWMFNSGMIKCTKHELLLALAKFQFCFFNFE